MPVVDPIRYTSSAPEVDLVGYLPTYLKGSETEQLVQFFETFLNELYEEEYTYNVDISVSVIGSGTATISDVTSATQKVSIIEKVNRLSELHDPELIDIEYIEFFARNMGYNVSVTKGELGLITSGTPDTYTSATSADNIEDLNKYVRFVVSNLPNWYRIKTTRNAIRIMLYSFGIIGDLYNYYTKDYDSQHILLNEFTDSLNAYIPDEYYPTPHFTIGIDLDNSITDVNFEETKRKMLVSAVESIRPANTVFESLTGILNRKLPTFESKIRTKTNLFMYIPWDS